MLQVLKVSIHLKSKDYGIKSFIVCYMQNIKSDADNSFVPGLFRYILKCNYMYPLRDTVIIVNEGDDIGKAVYMQ